MNETDGIFEEVPGLYKVIPLKPFRHTKGVAFDIIPMDLMPKIAGVDRVMHAGEALSPGAVGEVERPWYMHTHQEDYLMVMQGVRCTDIYSVKHGKVENFEVAPNYIKKNGKMLYDGNALLVWPCEVFHRIKSETGGSASINLAIRHEGFDVKTNFSIYDLNTETGEYHSIRHGSLDQQE